MGISGHRRIWTCKGDPGVTLIEVMIALMILTVGVLAAGAMQGVGMAGIVAAQRGTHHSVAAVKRLEQILCLPFDDPLLADRDGDFLPDSPDHGPFALADGRGTIEWEVADDWPVAGAKRIRVTVREPAKAGAARPVVYDHVRVTDSP